MNVRCFAKNCLFKCISHDLNDRRICTCSSTLEQDRFLAGCPLFYIERSNGLLNFGAIWGITAKHCGEIIERNEIYAEIQMVLARDELHRILRLGILGMEHTEHQKIILKLYRHNFIRTRRLLRHNG